tara:strand:+ start:286 stop:600 length:315 start_codon:yes stop_codon:yes gene_type:complete
MQTIIKQLAMLEGNTWEEKLQTTINCNCCERHNKDKPDKLLLWIETPVRETRLGFSDCKCPCRHHARFICRIYNDVICPKYTYDYSDYSDDSDDIETECGECDC